jgi:hypothetical protein
MRRGRRLEELSVRHIPECRSLDGRVNRLAGCYAQFIYCILYNLGNKSVAGTIKFDTDLPAGAEQ